MNKTRGLLLTAGIVLATAFTLSCEEKNADKPSAAVADTGGTATSTPVPKTAEPAKDEKSAAGVITMSTGTDNMGFQLRGSGTATIDWGDGSQPETVKLEEIDASELSLISHKYSNTNQRTVTITGANITGFYSDYSHKNQLTALDASRNTTLKVLNITDNLLTAEALNALFSSLHNKDFEKYIRISYNPGLYKCDPGIAYAKGWTVDREEMQGDAD